MEKLAQRQAFFSFIYWQHAGNAQKRGLAEYMAKKFAYLSIHANS